MGTFQINKIVNRNGEIRTPSDTDIVDMYGNIKTSAQFKQCKVPDIYGNLGCLILTPIGYYNGQANTDTPHILTYTYDYQSFGGNYTPANIVEFGCLVNYHIIFTGVIAGLQYMRIAGSDDSLGEFNGGGTVIFTGANTYNNVTYIQAPDATLVLGTLTGTSGSIAASEAWVENGATLDMLGAYTSYTNVVKNLTSIAGSTTNVKGPGVCGQGMFKIKQSTSSSIGGTINIEDAILLQDNLWGGQATSSINVLDGGTFEYSTFTNSVKVNINGCGWCDASNVQQGAIKLNSNLTISSAINVQSSACIKSAAGVVTTFDNPLTGSEPLLITTTDGLPSASTKVYFTDTASTYSGIMSVKNLVVRPSTTALDATDFNLSDSGFLQTSATTAGYNVSDIIVSTANAGISVVPTSVTVNNVCGKILAETFSAPNGFTVNAYSNLKTAGTYDILVVSGTHTTTLPIVGINTTGKTLSFAWVGNTLKMTLA